MMKPSSRLSIASGRSPKLSLALVAGVAGGGEGAIDRREVLSIRGYPEGQNDPVATELEGVTL